MRYGGFKGWGLGGKKASVLPAQGPKEPFPKGCTPYIDLKVLWSLVVAKGLLGLVRE